VDEHKIGPRHRGWDRGTAKHCRRRPQSSCRKSGNWDRFGLDGKPRQRSPSCTWFRSDGGGSQPEIRFAIDNGDGLCRPNLERRQLTQSQAAIVAARISNLKRGGDGSNQHRASGCRRPL